MSDINATQARKEFFELLKSAVRKHKIYHIRHRDGDAVLMSQEEYESLQETMELLSVPGFAKSIKQSLKEIERGETFSLDEVLGE